MIDFAMHAQQRRDALELAKKLREFGDKYPNAYVSVNDGRASQTKHAKHAVLAEAAIRIGNGGNIYIVAGERPASMEGAEV